MTEEKKEVYEIKKESVKQFGTILGASFIGCFLAILLAGQLIKPKAPCPPHCGHKRPPHVHVHRLEHHKPHKMMQNIERKTQPKIENQAKLQKQNLKPGIKIDA